MKKFVFVRMSSENPSLVISAKTRNLAIKKFAVVSKYMLSDSLDDFTISDVKDDIDNGEIIVSEALVV